MRQKKLLAAMLCGLLLTGCAAQPQAGSGTDTDAGSAAEPTPTVTHLSQEDFPSFGGCQALSLPGNLAAAAAVKTDISSAKDLTGFYGSSDEAWQRLLEGNTDIVLAYQPSKEVQQQLQSSGAQMEQLGTDGLVFLTGGTATAQNLTRDQIIDAYGTQSGNWTGYAAASGTSCRQLFVRLLQIDAAGVLVQNGTDTLTAACPHTEGTLCYTTYFSLLENGLPEGTAMASVDGVLPSVQTLADGSYSLSAPYYVACRSGLDNNAPAMLLYRWLISDAGRTWLADQLA